MKVLSSSNPHAMMSRAFAYLTNITKREENIDKGLHEFNTLNSDSNIEADTVA